MPFSDISIEDLDFASNPPISTLDWLNFFLSFILIVFKLSADDEFILFLFILIVESAKMLLLLVAPFKSV